jgi:hypothetical protein
MNDSPRSWLFKLATHPAITVLFAVVGLYFGITAINRSSNEVGNKASSERYIEEMNDLRSGQRRLESAVSALEAKTEDLSKHLAELNAVGQRSKVSPASAEAISLGQTRDQVVATLGVPTRVMKLGAKEIDFFPNMKVTFLHDKVVDVQ